MSLTWGQIKEQIDKEVSDDERVQSIEYMEEPYLTITYSPRKKEVEIWGTFESAESREG